MSDDGIVLSDAEWDDVFNNPEDEIVPRGVPGWARVLGWIAALAMLISSFAVLANAIQELRRISEPIEILTAAWDYTETSDWGWLVSDIKVAVIEAPSVGAFVRNNPPDGVVTVDVRGWDESRLDELMAHEIGHLIEFAAYRPGTPNPRGGLEREVWAECAAVWAGERSTDGDGDSEVYRCTGAEFEVFESEMLALAEVCRPWGEAECRRIEGGVPLAG